MRRLAAAALLLIFPGCATITPDVRDPYFQGAVAAGAADLATTYVALDRVEGADEANPVLALCGDGSAKAVTICGAALKSAWIIAATSVENYFGLTGWPKRILWLFPIGLWGGAAAWNASIIWD